MIGLESWFANFSQISQRWITAESLAEIPRPHLEYAIWGLWKGGQVMSILGGLVVHPIYRLYQQRQLTPETTTTNSDKIIRNNCRRIQGRFLLLGLVGGPMLAYFHSNTMTESELKARCYQIRLDGEGLTMDRMTFVFGFIGWYWRRFQGAVDGINLGIVGALAHRKLVAPYTTPMFYDAIPKEEQYENVISGEKHGASKLKQFLIEMDEKKATNRLRRSLEDNLLKDDPTARCRNGGIFEGGQCHCIHPHTGPTCQDYACTSHGKSVGRRYDPNSLFFNKPCICDEGWEGDLCEFRLTDRCSDRGEWVKDHCHCMGYFFGSECQYTSRCDQGTIRHGRCICNTDWEGDYCHQILCHHGYADTKNNSKSCVCPPQYKGIHCDECAQVGPKIEPYPKCVVNLYPRHAIQTRKKTKTEIRHRFIIIMCACAFLAVIALMMVFVHYRRKKNKNPEVELARQQELDERTAMLTEQAMTSAMAPVAQRKKSLLGTFQLRRDISKDSSFTKKDPRRLSLQNPFTLRDRSRGSDENS
ncbi:unnamed protein product, partial [Mesorhabditis belari]|uniref:EGF-like domain-containing protein n=1 Tax=Mesorhabditis belari TaxID=2138241 RepID=A0AAF3J5C1_9BILA